MIKGALRKLLAKIVYEFIMRVKGRNNEGTVWVLEGMERISKLPVLMGWPKPNKNNWYCKNICDPILTIDEGNARWFEKQDYPCCYWWHNADKTDVPKCPYGHWQR